MEIFQDFSLKQLNTFGINVAAEQFAVFKNLEQLQELLEWKNHQPLAFILGGGSNILFTKNVDGFVLKNEIDCIEKIGEDEKYVFVSAGAGVSWHGFVLHCIQNNWAGVENLSLIPGNVGASPMQNIGAYGVEIKDVFHELHAWHIQDKVAVTFNLADCEFGYRESVFKRKLKNQFVISSVTYRLSKTPILNTSYGAIEEELKKMKITTPTIQSVSQAVINIRSSKLPNPAAMGNAGSFFKNPTVENEIFISLKNKFPSLVGYALTEGKMKLAAGWLIENAGPQVGLSWKGYRIGDAGCHAKQALVLVNYGQATGNEIWQLSETIIASVKEKFDVLLEREVNIL